ncbi:MAG TPA: lysophospholipase, partial [Candidatus Atribacteria bacterium]|nr:lysophospholipase [Candidatus Atribacteria bacterium]
MAEHAGRYGRFADFLANNGYIVYANDHRGHGRTAGDPEAAGYLGRDGFFGMARDMKLLTDRIKAEEPDLPLYLFGHSMGSFLAQYYITKWGGGLKGVILSGSNLQKGPVLKAGIIIAGLQRLLLGDRKRSKLLNSLSFDSFNKRFRPVRTPFDWLSRDTAEVDRYVADPYCGAVFTTSFFHDFFKGLDGLYDKAALEAIPKDLPVLILSGDMDPVGGFGKGPRLLEKLYHSLGLLDVTLKLYTDGRHEMLNEINRDEVMKDILGWLGKYERLL